MFPGFGDTAAIFAKSSRITAVFFPTWLQLKFDLFNQYQVCENEMIQDPTEMLDTLRRAFQIQINQPEYKYKSTN